MEKHKLTIIRQDITVFRFAYRTDGKSLDKLKGAISSQWKVKIETIELVNKVALVSIKKDSITNNVTKFVQVSEPCLILKE